MSAEIQPVLKVTDYLVATSTTEVQELIAEGYEPHGSAILVGFDLHQPMVKREMISVDEYVEMMSMFLEVAQHVQAKIGELSRGPW